MRKRGILLLLVFLLTAGLFASGLRDGGNGELVLLHTNDLHGNILPNAGRGGYAQVAAFVDSVRVVNQNVLLVDAGDFNTGTALSNMFDAEPDIRAMNLMRYDASTFGNHEFDGSMAKLENQIRLAEFPLVSSNITTQNGSFLGGYQYIIKQYDGFKVGIFGLTTLRTRVIASPDRTLNFINEIEAARRVVDILRNTEKVDLVVGLTHMGNIKETEDHITSVELAKEVAGIDILVDGHSHSYIQAPIKAGDTWIVTANEWGKYVGYGIITIENGKMADFIWAPVSIQPNTEITAMLEPFIEESNEILKEVVGQAAETFVFGNRLTRYQETALGNMICDANVWYFREERNWNIDFAFHNGGNIRAELPAGPITRETILTILPFENYLYIASMKGSDIIRLFDFIGTIPQGNGGFPQFSSDVRYIIDKTEGSGVVRNLTIGGSPVDPDRVYTFCTNDYIHAGGDGYVIMENAYDHYNASLLLSYVVMEYVSHQTSPIRPVLDGRLTVIGGVTP